MGGALAQRRQDAGGMGVVPVVQHAGQQIQLGRGWRGEQVPGGQHTAVGNPLAFQDGPGALQHLWLVDQDALGAWGGLEHGRQQGADPAGDVGDRG